MKRTKEANACATLLDRTAQTAVAQLEPIFVSLTTVGVRLIGRGSQEKMLHRAALRELIENDSDAPLMVGGEDVVQQGRLSRACERTNGWIERLGGRPYRGSR